MPVALYGDSYDVHQNTPIEFSIFNFHEAQNINIKCFPDGHWHYQTACTFKLLEPRNIS